MMGAMPRDRHLTVFAVILAVLGAPLSLFLVLVPLAALRIALSGLPPGDADDAWIVAIVLPLGFGLGLLGAWQLAVARGLWRMRRWAWWGGLAICALWCMGALIPFGAYGLFALLRAPVREQFA